MMCDKAKTSWFVSMAAAIVAVSLFAAISPSAGLRQAYASTATDASSANAQAAASSVDDGGKLVLFINSYDPGFDTVPVVSEQVALELKGYASIHYLYMNEKYETNEFASAQLSAQLDYLMSSYHYDAVILGDDAAFDFAMENRDKYFSGTPLVYEDVNSIEKAELYEDDPLITGVIEAFPMKETIELARHLMPNATRVVVISDGSVSAAGSVEQAMDEQANFPDLSFETFDCSTRTPEQIASDIAVYGDDAILLYTVFNADGSGNRYSVAQGVKLVTDAAQVPVFKADGVGVGDGLLGGYVLSYESIGRQTGEIVREMLDGNTAPSVRGYTTGICEYLFDASVMQRFGIKKSQMPDGSVYINDTPSFIDQYGRMLAVAIVVAAAVIAGVVWASHLKRRKMQQELDARNMELKAEEAANRAKTEFISRMSHDIRTPLNAMLGMNELARESIGDEDALRDYLAKSHASGELLLSLVNNVLDVSKIESGNMQLSPSAFQMKEFLEDLRSIFEPLCMRKDMDLGISYDVTGEVVMADRVRMDQVFCNLLANAVKFTPEGGSVTLALASTTSDAGSPQAVLHGEFTVSDTGPGIAKDFQGQLFKSFARDTRFETSVTEGSGLGLVIVKSIVDLMGGTITVESELGSGTTFVVHLDLPLATEAPTPAYAGKASTEASARQVAAGLSGSHVLVVEDNDLNAEIITTVLEKCGAEVSRVVNGRVAVDEIASCADGSYDVILMDNRMPVMSGMEAARAIRAMDREWARRVPIIALTADAFDDDVKSILDAGMNACLTKPIDADKLCRTIASYI